MFKKTLTGAFLMLAMVLSSCGIVSPSDSPAPTQTMPALSSEANTPLLADATALPTMTAPTSTTAAPIAQATTQATSEVSATLVPTPTNILPAQRIIIELQEVAKGFDEPLYVADAGDASGRLFVVERKGRIKILRDGAILETPFVDLTERVGSGSSEQGLLSVAFHPRFSDNGYLYVNYTNKSGDTVISRLSSFGNSADPDSELILLTVDQPYANHNGGLNLFGPDGFLYIGLGDGGSGGDPENRAQNLDELLGKILRIDVDSGEPYAIPADNPWAQGGGRPEIWALGLRNPWRFSFDRRTGAMYIGDVGQNKIEEIDVQPAGQGGLNYGWKQLEGTSCYVDACDPTSFVAPIAEYAHEQGCSVTGGYVYRGASFPTLDGVYFYADYCQGTIWALMRNSDNSWISQVALESDARISSFGQDGAGELYVSDIDAGIVYRLVTP